MTSSPTKPIKFGPYEVTNQVFHATPLTYCLVNIKPILPGHVLVIPFRPVPRLTDLHADEITDLFTTVQKVERMLARTYFPVTTTSKIGNENENQNVPNGSFNIALQDGPESGQTVSHVHVHVIPRPSGDGEGDGVYDRLQGEEGNVGGGLWDRRMEEAGRPVQRGKFPRVEDEDRKPRSTEEMNREAEEFRRLMREVE